MPIDIDKIEKEWEEEQKKKQERQRELSPREEEITFDVVDLAYTHTGTLAELYAANGKVWVAPVDEKVEQIADLISTGRVVRVRAVRFKYYKRLKEIVEIRETKEVDTTEDHILKGIFDVRGRSFRILLPDGSRYYISEGTIGFEKLDEALLDLSGREVVALVSQVIARSGSRGQYRIVRGIMILKPDIYNKTDEEKVEKEGEEEFVAEV